MDRIQFRPGLLAPALTARGASDNAGAAQIASRDLGRYYDLLALALSSVTLTREQAGLLVDILNGSVIDLTTAQMLAAEIEDAEPESFAKWGVDRAALLDQAQRWTLLQRMAVCDAVERFWAQGHIESTWDRLALVGLVKRG